MKGVIRLFGGLFLLLAAMISIGHIYNVGWHHECNIWHEWLIPGAAGWAIAWGFLAIFIWSRNWPD